MILLAQKSHKNKIQTISLDLIIFIDSCIKLIIYYFNTYNKLYKNKLITFRMDDEQLFNKIFRLFGSHYILKYLIHPPGHIYVTGTKNIHHHALNNNHHHAPNYYRRELKIRNNPLHHLSNQYLPSVLNLLTLSKSVRHLLFNIIMTNIEVPFSSAVQIKYDDYNQLQKLHIDFNYPIDIDVLPKNLKELRFGDSWNRYQDLTTLPSSLTKIVFGKKNYKPLNESLIFPKNLKCLIFGDRYNQPLSDAFGNRVLPDGLTSITFGENFRQELMNDRNERVLPDSLTELTFGGYFNSKLNNNLNESLLPENLIKITFGTYFNRYIAPGILPQSLTHIIFGHQFNQPLSKDILPLSLIELEIGGNFRKMLNRDSLPLSLIKLTIPYSHAHRHDLFDEKLLETISIFVRVHENLVYEYPGPWKI